MEGEKDWPVSVQDESNKEVLAADETTTEKKPNFLSSSRVLNGSTSEIGIPINTSFNEQATSSNSSSSGGSAPQSKALKKQKKRGKDATSTEDSDESDRAIEHLPPGERDIIKRQLVVPPVTVTYKTLYRLATRTDLIIMFISTICAIIGGAALPLMTIIFGTLTQKFKDFFAGTIIGDEFTSQLNHTTLYFIYIGIAEFITIYICTAGFLYTGEHIARKIREQYLAAILRQNIGFFDKLGAGEITTRITADTNLVQDGISEKVPLTITAVATFITAFVVGFIKYWKLTLILTSVIFAIAFTMGSGSRFIVKWNKKSIDSYAVGGTVAEEVVSSIRNTTAFSTQDKLAKQYDAHLTEAERWGFRQKSAIACMMGGMMCFVYLNYGLAFWQGSRFYVQGDLNLADILTILMSIMIGAFSLGNVGPNVQAFTTATAAGAKIYSTIDRVSPLDPTVDTGDRLDHVQGTVELKHIKHIYPSRPEVLVMEDVSLMVPAGKTTALVGASGSGKSTIIGLVERFYDPVGGNVLLDGVDISTLNLQWLRQQISLVSQEPTLFNVTVAENIAHGLIGSKYEGLSSEKQRDLIIQAAKMANAHDFVTQLPEGYDTNVGERAGLLSGGQKQRIAIARAVVSDPKILLLDEATSALDTKSEGVVQAALDKAAEGRTTIIIAHRLSTIKTADNIVVMQEGRIVEQGRHDELLHSNGAYASLVAAQQITAANESNEGEGTDLEKDEVLLRQTMEKGVEYREDPDDNIAYNLMRTTTTKSVSSNILKNRPAEKVHQYGLWTLLKLVGSFNKKEWKIMMIGFFLSILAGGGNPVQSIFFAKNLVALSRPPSEYGELRSQVNFWCLMYLMLGIVQFFSWAGQGICFAYCSERLVHRARDQSFRTILRQDIEFFDKEENTAGAMTSFLSTETTYLAGLSGSTLGTILIVTTTLVTSFTLSTAIGWKLALVCISTVPILLGCGFFRFYMLFKFVAQAKKAYEKSAGYACEATSAIRTVASLTRERDVWETYHQQLVSQGDRSLHSVLRSSLLYAASQSLMFLVIALGFWYGGTLIAHREYDMFQFFVCFSSVIFGAQSAGTIFSFAPAMGKAKHAAQEMKTLFDRVPKIDPWDNSGDRLPTAQGALEFRDVHFRYPTRPEQPVLRGLNLSVQPGQYIALVGPSGCGKSTTIGLLERFYDPTAGGIYIDGHEISSLNLSDYRAQLALVSQEPTLYQGNIRSNILLGSDKPDASVSDADIEQACKDANIYNFILSLPDGFNTVVGSKGTLLSGGQKQRVAIARALLRNPKVLLLDEATSALDSESEKVVQAALDNAAKGRTTVAVAHRLSTIQNADCIYVFEGGRIVESGTHGGLMARRGRYFELVKLQSLTGTE